jgi:hypothetical protein
LVLDQYACDLVSHWRAKRRRVVGRRRCERMASVGAGADRSRSRRRAYASTCDTPSRHLWEGCAAGIELARCRRSAPDAGRTGAQKGCRRAQSFWRLGVPKCIASTATLRKVFLLFGFLIRRCRDCGRTVTFN